jgi:hypothetical protein
MHELKWQKVFTESSARWLEGAKGLTGKGASHGQILAFEALLDRLLYLSDNFRPTNECDVRFVLPLFTHTDEFMSRDDRERLYLKLLRSRDPSVVERSMGPLSRSKNPAVLDNYFGIADGPDRRLALKAIGWLGNTRDEPRIARFLRHKMADPDPLLALHAAITTCYTGDWFGLPVMLRCTRSTDPDVRMDAIAQCVDHIFLPYSEKVVPLLLEELKTPLSDAHLERAIHSLETYPGDRVAEAVTPFLTHKNEHVRARARATLEAIQRERSRKKD